MTNDQVLQHIQHLVGSRYVPSVKPYITELTGRTRVVGVDELTALDINPERIKIQGNAAGAIVSFSFG
jgi:hypothetical protein